jgi:ATP-dependent DNA ligase
MPRVVKRSASQALKTNPSRRGVPLPAFVPPQLSQPVEKPPSGPQWVHEIKLDGFRMAARVDNGRVQLLTRTGVDWTAKYPNAVAALLNVNVKTAYLDGELSGVDDAGFPSFAQIQAATDGERDARLVYFPFDILHLAGRDVSGLPLLERKALLEPLVVGKQDVSSSDCISTSDGKPGPMRRNHELRPGFRTKTGRRTMSERNVRTLSEPSSMISIVSMVGAAGFEPAT